MSSGFEVVKTDAAPKPLPQFSQAVKYNGMVYCSGNIGIRPDGDFKPIEGTVKDRTVRFAPICMLFFEGCVLQAEVAALTPLASKSAKR